MSENRFVSDKLMHKKTRTDCPRRLGDQLSFRSSDTIVVGLAGTRQPDEAEDLRSEENVGHSFA